MRLPGKQTVYIETSIISLLKRRPSHNTVEVARQILTHQWWEEQKPDYQLVTSQYVIDEAAAGDPEMASARLLELEGIPLLPLEEKIAEVAESLIEKAILSPKSVVDALHISIAAFHRIEYLLTWNCSHIANAKIQRRIRQVLEEMAIPMPIICTPQEMVEDD
jgi:hypothetical protein